MKRNPHAKLLALALGVALAALGQPGQHSAQAASYTWDPTQNPASPAGGGGTWDTSSALWSDGTDHAWTDVTGANDTAVFGGLAGGAVTLGQALGAAGLKFTTAGYSISSGTLTLGGGGIDASGLTSGVTTISSPLTLLGGQQYWKVGAGSSLVVNGALTRNAGNAVNFTTGINVNGSGLANNNGILGGWATMGNAGTAGSTGDWASLDGSGNVVAYTGYTNIAGAFANGNATNYNITGNSTTGQLTVNSVRMGADLTINAGSTLYLNSGGLMLNGISRWLKAGNATTSKLTANGGTLYIDSTSSGGTGDDNWQIQAVIVDNGVMGINKNGPGMVALTNANNSFTGNIVINSGRLEANGGINGDNVAHVNSAIGDIGSGQSRTITVNSGGTLAFTGVNVAGWSNGTMSTVNLVVNSGGVFQTGANTTANTGYWNKIGPITLNGGSVLIGAGDTGTWGGALSLLGTVTVGGNTASTIGSLAGAVGGAKNFINIGHSNTGISSVIFNVADATGDSGADLTVSPKLANGSNNGGASSLTKTGAGTLALTAADSSYTGVTTINAGTLKATALANGGSASSIGQSSNAASNLVFDGGALEYGGATIASDRAFTINAGKAATIQVDSSSANLALAGATGAVTTGTLVKTGAGTLTLTGANTYTGGTRINAGTLQIGNGGTTGSLAVTGGIINNGTLVLNRSNATTQGTDFGAISGGGAITLAGSGTTTLSTASSGVTTVNNGAALSNASGATLTLGALTFLGNGSVSVNETGFTKGLAAAALTTANAGLGEITINVSNSSTWLAGSYDLITFTSLAGGLSDFTKGTITGLSGRQNATLGTSATAVTLTIGGDIPVWSGAGSQTWTTAATNDNTGPNAWALLSGHTATNYWATDAVQFNDTYNLGAGDVAVTNSTVDIAGGVAPASTVFNNSSVDYTINSADATGITAGSLSKNGTGTVTINTANSYTGGTVINSGTLQVGNTAALGASTGALAINGGALNLAGNSVTVGDLSGAGLVTNSTGSSVLTAGGASGATFSGTLSDGAGNLAFTKAGTGTQILTGFSSYTGPTTINSGTLQIGDGVADGSIASSSGIANNGALGYNLVGSQTYANIISGTGSLTKSGLGTLILTGSNTYTGATTISSGTLQMGDGVTDGSIASTSAITDNGVLAYNLVGSRTLDKTVSGVGSLTKTGAGTLTLTGANTYSGGTTINGGTLEFDTTSGSAVGTININNGARLQINQAANNFGYNPTINLGADAFLTNAGTGGINFSGVLNGNGHALNVSTNVSTTNARLFINSTTSNISQFNVTSGAMGFDLNNGNNGGGAPVFVSDGASLYFANGNSTMANNVTLSGTGLNGLGALYQENGATATLSGTITLAGDTTFGGSSATGVAKMNGPILGTGALTKVGANLYSLTGSNSYSGPTNINAGTLATAGVNGANLNLGAGNVNVNSGGILRLGYGVTGNNNQNVTTTNNNVTLAGGTIYADDAFQHLAGSLNVTAASIVGATYNSGNNGAAEQDKGLALDVVVSGSGALTIQHTRFDTTHAWDTAFVAFNNNSNTYTGNVTVNENTAANEGGVYLGIGATNALQNSTISISAIPTTGGSGRFGSSPIVFKTGLGSATLGAISGSAPLILTGYDEINHAQGSDAIVLTVGGNGASTSYTGEISGLGSLTKTGAGTFTMNGASTYSGATNVNNGTLTVGNSSGSATGTGLVTVANGATLNGTGSVVGAVTVSGALSGSVGVGGNLTINSLGSMSGSHALAGNVALNNGTVSNVTSDLSLASGKTLSGLGGTVGSVTVASTSTVAPGNSGVGNLTLGGLTTVSGAHLSMDINGTTAGGYDMLTITGSINLLSGGDLTLNLSSFTPGPGSEIIFLVDNTQGIGNTSGAFDNITLNLSGGATGALVSGNGAEGSRININGTVYALTYTANYEGGANFGGNDIALAAVPEPSTWAMMVGGVGMLLSLQRRKRSSH